jgi:cell wall assembly regulator SMI1
MIEIIEPNQPLTEEQVAPLEAKMGATFPEPYRTFLMTHNGGRPKPNLIDIDGSPFDGADIDLFHGIGTDHETTEISWNLEAYKGCLENKLLPFACDSGGNIFTIPLTGEERGSVYYFRWWHLGRPVDPPEPWLVAPDFQTFLDRIHDWTPEELAYFDSLEPQYYRSVKMGEPGRKLTDADIEQLEKSIGLPLPDSYKGYLKAFNGGVPSPNVLDIDWEDVHFASTQIEVFFSCDADDPNRDLLHHWNTVLGARRADLLPIARDIHKRCIVLDLRPETFGKLCYLIEEAHGYGVANHFDELIEQLREPTRAELGLPELVDVSVSFTGSRPADAALANASAGHETTPRGYVWHRHQDGETLQLVPKDVHKQTGDPRGYGLRWRSSS